MKEIELSHVLETLMLLVDDNTTLAKRVCIALSMMTITLVRIVQMETALKE